MSFLKHIKPVSVRLPHLIETQIMEIDHQ